MGVDDQPKDPATVLATAGQGSSEPLAIASFRGGCTAQASYRYRSKFASDTILNSGDGFRNRDENVYFNLHWDDVHRVNVVRRSGPVWELEAGPDSRIPEVRIAIDDELVRLDDIVCGAASRIQGFVVCQQGRIAYERYPGMDENDNHVWFSISKTLPSTLLTIFELQGRLDIAEPVGRYLPEAAGTRWAAIPVADILDMASGLDVAETERTLFDPTHKVNQHFRISLGGDAIPRDGAANANWSYRDLLYSAETKAGAVHGKVAEYSSMSTMILVMLVEAIAGRRFAEALSRDLWSLLGAEGDGLISVTPTGEASSDGLMSSRLRDLARYGLMFTEVWRTRYGAAAAERWGLREPLPSLARAIGGACRPHLYKAAQRQGGGLFHLPTDPEIVGSVRQWDLVYRDGDLFKGGVGGQGLYVSPARELVIAFFSTSDNEWSGIARTVATALISDPSISR